MITFINKSDYLLVLWCNLLHLLTAAPHLALDGMKYTDSCRYLATPSCISPHHRTAYHLAVTYSVGQITTL